MPGRQKQKVQMEAGMVEGETAALKHFKPPVPECGKWFWSEL